MNSKEHVIRLAGLERELRAMPDATIATLAGATTADAQKWLGGLSGGADGELDVTGLRGAIQRGRMKGVPDKVAAVLTDACLQDCITALGDHADLPTEAQLRDVTGGLVAKHGLDATRLMFASAVLGEAPAAPAILKLLKSDPSLARTA